MSHDLGILDSPYSSHLVDHIPIMESNGWVMWKMGTWLMTHDILVALVAIPCQQRSNPWPILAYLHRQSFLSLGATNTSMCRSCWPQFTPYGFHRWGTPKWLVYNSIKWLVYNWNSYMTPYPSISKGCEDHPLISYHYRWQLFSPQCWLEDSSSERPWHVMSIVLIHDCNCKTTTRHIMHYMTIYTYLYMGTSQNTRYGSRPGAHTWSMPPDPYLDPYPMIHDTAWSFPVDPYPWTIPLSRWRKTMLALMLLVILVLLLVRVLLLPLLLLLLLPLLLPLLLLLPPLPPCCCCCYCCCCCCCHY